MLLLLPYLLLFPTMDGIYRHSVRMVLGTAWIWVTSQASTKESSGNLLREYNIRDIDWIRENIEAHREGGEQ